MYVYGEPVAGSVWSVLAVQVPRGRVWKTPLSPPVVLHPKESPGVLDGTPMSDETTATCRSGKPPGSFLSTSRNVEKLSMRSFCETVIDDELSTMNRRSSFRLAVADASRDVVASEDPGAQPPASPAARAIAPAKPRP